MVTHTKNYSYLEWNQRVNSVAWGLIELGIKPGDSIGLCLANGEAAATMYFAIHKAGAVAVMLNTRWKYQNIAYVLCEAQVKVIVYDSPVSNEVLLAVDSCEQDILKITCDVPEKGGEISYEKLAGIPTDNAPEISRDDNDMGTILYTSGTTGIPKGVCRSSRSDYYSSLAIIVEHHWERFERILMVMPLYHTMGLHTLISMVLLNGTLIFPESGDISECLHSIVQEQITALYLVPTIYHNLLEKIRLEGCGHLHVNKLAFAGAPMSPVLVERCYKTFQPKIFINQYGCTEMLAITTNSQLDKKPTAAGRPTLHTRLRIVTADRNRAVAPAEVVATGDTGEIILHASLPQTFLGYLNKPEATKQVLHNGWYYTGDLGFLDADGDLFLTGRVDDMIISGGENVWPGEVEEILMQHPGVKEVAVVGLPDEQWGECITAFIVLALSSLTEEELDSFCIQCPDLARYKRPRKYIFLKEIPKSPAGKILRKYLKTADYVSFS